MATHIYVMATESCPLSTQLVESDAADQLLGEVAL